MSELDEFNNFVRLEPREVFDSFILGVEWADPERPRLVYNADQIIEHYRQQIIDSYENLGEEYEEDLPDLLENAYMEARQQFYEWCVCAKLGGCNTTDPIYVSKDDLEILMSKLPDDQQLQVKKVDE